MPPKDYTAITDHLDANFPRSTYPGVRISLKKHTDGEKDEEAAALSSDRLIARDGTARILRRMRQYIKVSQAGEEQWLTHSAISWSFLAISRHPPPFLLAASSTSSDRARRLSSQAFSTSPALQLQTVSLIVASRLMAAEPKLLVGYDRETEDLLLIQALDALEDDLELRMSLLER